jgi:hypothetical protein
VNPGRPGCLLAAAAAARRLTDRAAKRTSSAALTCRGSTQGGERNRTVALLQLYLLLSLVVDSQDFDAARPVPLSPRQYRQVSSR